MTDEQIIEALECCNGYDCETCMSLKYCDYMHPGALARSSLDIINSQKARIKELEERIKIYNDKDGTWDKDDLIDKAYEIITSPIKTNYDRIKQMSVEEMAKATTILFYKVKDYTNVEHYIKQWLEQEVEKNDR